MTDMATASVTTTTATKDHDHSLSGTFCHANHLPCPYQQRQQQHPLAIFLSPAPDTIPGTWVDSNVHYCHCQTAAAAANHQADMNHLRETIASLRDQAKQLEMTDLMVKKSIQVVAKKRRLAQHSSKWDWCDPIDDDEYEDIDDDDDDIYQSIMEFAQEDTGTASVPVLEDDASETDDDQGQDCGGDWEWVD